MAEKTDAELIEEYTNGDESALPILISRYLKPIYNFVFRMVGESEADDVTQEVFIKLWKNIKKYDSRQSFKTWAYRIARNTAIDRLRKKKEFVFSDFDIYENDGNILSDNLADTAPLPEELLIKTENKLFLDNLLSQISPNYREVLLLHYEEDMTFDEMGKVLGKPLNTVKSQHRRALTKLRELLQSAPKQVI